MPSGGKRKGAGRPPNPAGTVKPTFAVRLTAAQIRKLKRVAQARGVTATKVVSDLIDRLR